MDVKEWARNGSFMKKPQTGWLHDDAALEHGDGVYYPVKVRGFFLKGEGGSRRKEKKERKKEREKKSIWRRRVLAGQR